MNITIGVAATATPHTNSRRLLQAAADSSAEAKNSADRRPLTNRMSQIPVDDGNTRLGSPTMA
jgi:hypothetical protein